MLLEAGSGLQYAGHKRARLRSFLHWCLRGFLAWALRGARVL
jgi:hypothetical protein